MKNIICGIDDNYYQHCGAMLLSLFKHNADIFNVFILSLDVKEKHKIMLEELAKTYQSYIYFINIEKELIENFPMKKSDYPSLATYLRLFIPRLLPLEVDKALYVDSDIIFKSDITELYEMNLSNYSLAAMEDAPNKHPLRLGYSDSDLYFNAGLILMNIRYLRQISFTEKALEYIFSNKDKIVLHDQDVLNAILHGQVMFISIKWNMLDCFYRDSPFIHEKYETDLEEYKDVPNIIHFSGPLKPWHLGCSHPLKDEYFKYSSLIPWGCKRKNCWYVFKVYKFPANILIWFGYNPAIAFKISRKLGFKKIE